MAASPADEPAPWEPVITRPDPMTAEEWEACLERDLAEDQDPDELQDRQRKDDPAKQGPEGRVVELPHDERGDASRPG